MKLLILSALAPPHGGSSRVAFDQAKYLKRGTGLDITLASHEEGFSLLRHEQINVVLLPGCRVKGDYVMSPAGMRQLWRLVGHTDLVLIHSQYFVLSMVAAIMSRLRGKKTAVIHHGRLRSERRNKWNTKLMNPFVHQWFLVDQFDKGFLSRYCAPKPSQVILNGYDPEVIEPLYRMKERPRVDTFVYCGSLVVDKGMEELVAAIQHFRTVPFGIIGDGPYSNRLSQFPNVRLFGRREHREALAIMNEYDCLLLPSHHEGMPMVVVEALALGKPAIVTDLKPQLTDLVEGNGLIVQKENAGALIAAMEDAMARGLEIAKPEKIRQLRWPTAVSALEQALSNLAGEPWTRPSDSFGSMEKRR